MATISPKAVSKRLALERKYTLRTKYGITPVQYDEMFAAQEGVCAICQWPSEDRLAVDHCHKTNKIRGLLCRDCNVGLGCFKDITGRLLAALEYLQRAR